MALKSLTSRGLVLYDRAYREEDRLVKIFTEQAGKHMFFVKNLPKSRLSSALRPLTIARYNCKINDSGLSYLDDYSKRETFKRINQDIFKLAHASYLTALADSAIADGEVDAPLFAFLVKMLELMEEGLDEGVLTLIYEIQLLSRFGVSLDFSQCVFCHRRGEAFDFSFKYSGVLCPRHYHEDINRSHLNPNVPYLLAEFQAIALDRLREIQLGEVIKKELRQFMDELYENYVGLHLKSKHFLDGLGNWGDIMK